MSETTLTRTTSKGSVTITSDASGLFSKAVALVLKTSCLGVNRQLPKNAVTTTADADWVRASKKILDSKELEAIKSHISDTRRVIENLSTPAGMFRAGIYLVSIRLVPEADEYLVKSRNTLKVELVPKLAAKYTELKETAKVKLGPALYNPADYPSEAALADMFSIDWNYITVDSPAALEGIDASILERERAKASAAWSSALDEANAVLLAGMKELVDHMVERLQPAEDGKKRIFRDSLVGNFREFFRTFPERNLSGSTELNELAAEVSGLLNGVDAKGLRDNEALRDLVRGGMATVKAKLDVAICAAPARKYSADE
jgi:hypothetical protein